MTTERIHARRQTTQRLATYALAFAFALGGGAILAYAWIARGVTASTGTVSETAGRFFLTLTIAGAITMLGGALLAVGARTRHP